MCIRDSCRCINTLQSLFIFVIDVQNNVNSTVSPGRTEDDGKVYPSSLIWGLPDLVDRSIDCDMERFSRFDALCTVYAGAIIYFGVIVAIAHIKRDKDVIINGRTLLKLLGTILYIPKVNSTVILWIAVNTNLPWDDHVSVAHLIRETNTTHTNTTVSYTHLTLPTKA